MEHVDVVIVGAGLAGLSTAVFLGQHGVAATVLERHPSTSIQPKARGQMPVIMEAFESVGVAERIREAAPPGTGFTNRVARSMVGDVLHEFSTAMHDAGTFSPAEPAMASQAVAEQALADRARELGAALRFGTRVDGLTQDDGGVTLDLVDVPTGTPSTLRARYVVAADGHRGGLREMVGIGSHGRGRFGGSDSVRFAADLSRYAGDDAVVLVYVQNPDLPEGSGALVTTDVPGQWVAAGVATGSDDASTLAQLHTMIGVDDVAIEVLGRDTWESAHRVADRFSEGRVLLVGDAAHVMPPTGGQGGNTAMLDGYHLGWRLAAVVRGTAGESLLETHDAERRPYGEAVAGWQVANMVVRQRPDLADESIGLPMDGMTLLFGYVAPGSAVIAEDGAGELFDDPRKPDGCPGSRVPHVTLESPDGPVSPRQLLGPHFLVLTGSLAGEAAAARAAGALGVAVRCHHVGTDLRDPEGAWAERSGAGPDGTVLVRPDGVVAWRGSDPDGLTDALRRVLHR